VNIKKESKSTIFVLIIIIISLVIMFFLSMGMDHLNYTKNLNWLFYFLGYLFLLIFVHWLRKKFPNKMLDYIDIRISFPLSIFLLLFQFAIPSIGLVLHVFLFVLFSFAFPIILLRINEYFDYVTLTEQTTLFINLTFATCFSVAFYRQLLSFIYQFGPFRIKNSEKMKKFRLDELIEYVLNKENLIIFSFQLLQNSSVFEVAEKDRAIYQSFLCFLAFDRILLNSNKFILLPSQLLKKMINSITQKEKE
jgi:chromate transport protein ChrA